MSQNPPCIILDRPQLAQNIGAVARAMANFGLADLRLVNPRDGWPQERAWSTASGAEWPLNAARVYDRVEDAISDLHLVYATTARPRELQLPILMPREAMANFSTEVDQGRRVGLLFGAERAGLETADSGTIERGIKHLLTSVANRQGGSVELGVQMATHMLLGGRLFTSTHKFAYISALASTALASTDGALGAAGHPAVSATTTASTSERASMSPS